MSTTVKPYDVVLFVNLLKKLLLPKKSKASNNREGVALILSVRDDVEIYNLDLTVLI